MLFAEGSFPRLNTVEDGQDVASTGARSSEGEPRSEGWCGQPRRGNSARMIAGWKRWTAGLGGSAKRGGWTPRAGRDRGTGTWMLPVRLALTSFERHLHCLGAPNQLARDRPIDARRGLSQGRGRGPWTWRWLRPLRWRGAVCCRTGEWVRTHRILPPAGHGRLEAGAESPMVLPCRRAAARARSRTTMKRHALDGGEPEPASGPANALRCATSTMNATAPSSVEGRRKRQSWWPVRGWSKTYAKPRDRPDWDRVLGMTGFGGERLGRFGVLPRSGLLTRIPEAGVGNQMRQPASRKRGLLRELILLMRAGA